MAIGEFELISRYFANLGAERGDVVLGVGDDGAVLAPPVHAELVAVVDTLVEGVHFPRGAPAASVGHRAFAVNLSDLAAMGAEPAWALLALTLPSADESWLREFAAGAACIAREHGVALVGGDTTSGPLTISVQLIGFVPHGAALQRGGGKLGDAIVVSGTLGDAAAGLAVAQRKFDADAHARAKLLARFEFPTPRCALGIALRSIASACIDVSDGLAGDLGKLAAASNCGAEIEVATLPLSPELASAVGETRAREFALTGGDDYELCFTVPPAKFAQLARLASSNVAPITRIGTLVAGDGVSLRHGASVTQFSHRGFDHFGTSPGP
jgi:thiamine-monophosphate kinase